MFVCFGLHLTQWWIQNIKGRGGTSKPFVKRILTLFLFFSPQLIYSGDPISYFKGN